jgi:hypothetical protein
MVTQKQRLIQVELEAVKQEPLPELLPKLEKLEPLLELELELELEMELEFQEIHNQFA